jgi:hypothetical protein
MPNLPRSRHYVISSETRGRRIRRRFDRRDTAGKADHHPTGLVLAYRADWQSSRQTLPASGSPLRRVKQSVRTIDSRKNPGARRHARAFPAARGCYEGARRTSQWLDVPALFPATRTARPGHDRRRRLRSWTRCLAARPASRIASHRIAILNC